jgi:hypothetical protein
VNCFTPDDTKFALLRVVECSVNTIKVSCDTRRSGVTSAWGPRPKATRRIGADGGVRMDDEIFGSANRATEIEELRC